MSEGDYFLGLDLGTQSAKAVLCSATTATANGTDAVPSSSSLYSCSLIAVGHSLEIHMNDSTSSDHAEQDPARWITAIHEACHDLVKKFHAKYSTPLDATRIRSVAVSGHQHGLVLLDENDDVVRPCMMWCDTRAAAEAKSLSTRANYVCPAGFTAPKIMWLKSHEPENYRRTAKIMLPHDYINYYLSGNEIHVMERGDSSGMGIFSLQKNAFDDDLVNFIDKDLAAKLPIIVDPHLLIGSVSISVFRVLFPDYKVSDDSTSILLAPGCGDNAMSTLAVTSSNMSLLDSPNIAPPPLVMSLGTSGTLCTVSSHTLRDPTGGIAPFCDSTGNFLPLICIQNCTLVPEEMRKMFPALSIEEITDLAEKEPPGCEGVLIIPYFSEGGERTPNWPDSTGCLIGLKHGHMQRPGLLYRAALESIAYALLRGYQRMVHHGLQQSEQNSKINVVGGGAGNTLWRKIIADVFQIPVVVNNHEEATKAASAVGAALQAAAIALGVEVGSVALDLPKGSVTSCLPTSDTSLCDVYNTAFKRHVSISNSLFEVDLSAGDTTS